MLVLKLLRRGKKSQVAFRLVVVDKRKKPWGRFLENLGSYQPATKKINFKKERILFWLNKGAQLTPTVHNLLVRDRIINKPKIKIKIKKRGDAVKEKGRETSSSVSA